MINKKSKIKSFVFKQDAKRVPNSKNFINCIECGALNNISSKYCEKCGDNLVIHLICPNCNCNLHKTDKFCPDCGHKILNDVLEKQNIDIIKNDETPDLKSQINSKKEDIQSDKNYFDNDALKQIDAYIAKSQFEDIDLKNDKLDNNSFISEQIKEIIYLSAENSGKDKEIKVSDIEKNSSNSNKETLEKVNNILDVSKNKILTTPINKMFSDVVPLNSKEDIQNFDKYYKKKISELNKEKKDLLKRKKTQTKSTTSVNSFSSRRKALKFFKENEPQKTYGWICYKCNVLHTSPRECKVVEFGGYWVTEPVKTVGYVCEKCSTILYTSKYCPYCH